MDTRSVPFPPRPLDTRGVVNKKRVLVVDDDPDVLDGYELVLGLHYDVVVAASPEQASAVLRSEQPDVVLSDYKPTGVDVLVEAKVRCPGALLVLATAHDAESLPPSCAHATFFKPFSVVALRELIERAR